MTYDLLAPVWRVLAAGLRGVVLTIFFLAAGCGERTADNPSSGADGGRTKPTSVPPLPPEGVFFPEVRQEGGLDAVPTAQGGGKLTLDEKGCLRMLYGEGLESGWVPVWPPYLEPEAVGRGEVRIVDESSGRTVGEVGKGIFMSGSDISKEVLRENGILDEETWRELFERCPPGYSYFLVGGGVRVTQRH